MSNIMHTMGVLSGTSMDAIDVALVAHNGDQMTLVDAISAPIPPELRITLQQLCHPGDNEINTMGACDHALAECMADAINQLKDLHPSIHIDAVGSHGQTIRHHPVSAHPFTLQIGNPHIMTERTGLTIINDFRRRDIANGGQGAPLAPALHQHLFWQTGIGSAVVNIGGMSNITIMDGHEPKHSIGYDTGPGNCLMDRWIQKHRNQNMDTNGDWARQGKVIPRLLKQLKQHEFFTLQGCKSTGHETFHLTWLESLLQSNDQAVDVQRTLLELTAQTIADAMHQAPYTIQSCMVCGGGAYNSFLMERLADCSQGITIQSTQSMGIAPEWVEAILFAWLAYQHLQNNIVDLRHITGAKVASILGTAYNPSIIHDESIATQS